MTEFTYSLIITGCTYEVICVAAAGASPYTDRPQLVTKPPSAGETPRERKNSDPGRNVDDPEVSIDKSESSLPR